MDGLRPSTLALLLEFLPNRRFDSDDDNNNSAELNGDAKPVCIAYTPGDVNVIAETLKRLAKNQEEKETKLHEAAAARVFQHLEPSFPGNEAFNTLARDGIVRMNDIIDNLSCDALLKSINLSLENELAMNNPQLEETGFGNVLSRKNRWDLYLENEGIYNECLVHMFRDPKAPLSILFNDLFDGFDCSFHEFSALISDCGACSQPIHPDSMHDVTSSGFSILGPMYTVFLALQDIDESMGPTLFLPRTNTQESHESYKDSSTKDAFFAQAEYRLSLLRRGDVAIMDSRTLHCGFENTSAGISNGRRVLLYLTLRHPAHFYECVPAIPKGSKWEHLTLNISDLL